MSIVAKPGPDLSKYIPLKEVAKLYGVSSKTLLVYKGEIDHVKRFGKIYFVKESLAAYIEAGKPADCSAGLIFKRDRPSVTTEERVSVICA